jgi:hypothetical protein
MNRTFRNAALFNQDIGKWIVSKVSDMKDMFRDARKFNQNIGYWDVSSVYIMNNMFRRATAFDQNLASWDISSVVNKCDMFRDAVTIEKKFRSMKVPHVRSFFDEQFSHLDRTSRFIYFESFFAWDRRKAYIMFLVGLGYLPMSKKQSSAYPRIENNRASSSCDAIFDMEDVSKYICSFL